MHYNFKTTQCMLYGQSPSCPTMHARLSMLGLMGLRMLEYAFGKACFRFAGAHTTSKQLHTGHGFAVARPKDKLMDMHTCNTSGRSTLWRNLSWAKPWPTRQAEQLHRHYLIYLARPDASELQNTCPSDQDVIEATLLAQI